MPQAPDARTLGDRIEALLGELDAAGDPAVRSRAEELVRLLMEFYGAGLARMAAGLEAAGAGGRELLETLAEDELVGGLLVLHDLHPVDLETRVGRALDRVRPY
ncbi:MAG: NifU family protein, partial [Actinomycetota bacterium]|nr:NifU family protein [Actinomycetota bacterium]